MKGSMLRWLAIVWFVFMGMACRSIPDGSALPDGDGGHTGIEIPQAGNGITEIGTPVEEPAMPNDIESCVYRDDHYGIIIRCPWTWSLAALEGHAYTFTSKFGVDVQIAFQDLEPQETLSSFVHNVRGSEDGLKASQLAEFDEVVCAAEEVVDAEKGLVSLECYAALLRSERRFVVIVAGVADQRPQFIILSMARSALNPGIYRNQIATEFRTRENGLFKEAEMMVREE